MKKFKNVREHNFENGANDSELDKDTDIKATWIVRLNI